MNKYTIYFTFEGNNDIIEWETSSCYEDKTDYEIAIGVDNGITTSREMDT